MHANLITAREPLACQYNSTSVHERCWNSPAVFARTEAPRCFSESPPDDFSIDALAVANSQCLQNGGMGIVQLTSGWESPYFSKLDSSFCQVESHGLTMTNNSVNGIGLALWKKEERRD
jgi:hypothetical protein